MKITRWIVPILVLSILFGSVGIAKVFGWWQTTGRSIATLSDASPEDIRGSSTLTDLSGAFGIPMAELYTLLNVPTTFPPETQLKELEEFNEVSAVRALVAERLGIPWESDETEPKPEATQAPQAAATPQATVEHTGPTPLPQGQVMAAADIKGNMTLNQVAKDTGMPLDALYAELKLPADLSADTALRDVGAKVPGFETSVVRDVVAAYQAAH